MEDERSAVQALDDVLLVLGARLTADERAAVAAKLPVSLRPALLAGADANIAQSERDIRAAAASRPRSTRAIPIPLQKGTPVVAIHWPARVRRQRFRRLAVAERLVAHAHAGSSETTWCGP